MWWRASPQDFRAHRGNGNRRAFRKAAGASEAPGVLAYAGKKAVAWCAIAPREAYPRLERSRIFKPIDEAPVWSVTCFFVAKAYRRRGVTVPLLRAAVAFAGRRGARIVEGYPVEPRKGSLPDPFAWTGFASAFRRAGFVEAARRSETRPMMRCVLRSGSAG
jgi:GNAT superfamily N-acetyltransferase